MKDYSKKCLQLAIDELCKTCINKEYADKKIQYMNRYYGKLYTEKEIIKEAQALINEGTDEIYIGVKIAKVDYRGTVEYVFGSIAYLWSDRCVPCRYELEYGSSKKSIYEYFGDKNVIGYTIEGASCNHGNLIFYFSHDDKAKEIWENEIYGTNNNDKPNLLEFSEFGDTHNIRNYILDNRDEYDGYVVRSNNNWDTDTIYLWHEMANGKIIWRKQKMSNNDFDKMLQSLLHTAAKSLERSARILKVLHELFEVPACIRDEYSKQAPGVIVYDEDGEVAFVGTLGQVSVFLGITGNKIHRLIKTGEATEDGYTVDVISEGDKK